MQKPKLPSGAQQVMPARGALGAKQTAQAWREKAAACLHCCAWGGGVRGGYWLHMWPAVYHLSSKCFPGAFPGEAGSVPKRGVSWKEPPE